MDKRILNTKKKLTNTLLLLINEKKIKDITVLELCQKAKINRTTFYKYYKDVDDLIFKIEESLLTDLEKYINDIKRNYLITYTSKIIETIANHKEIYTRILSENGDHTFLRRILSLVYDQSIIEWEKLLKKATRSDLEKIYNFIVDGTIGIVEAWIKSNCQEEPNNVAIFINKICMSGLSSFI
ncbi:MAG TPA: TetR family transcriptional regulator C-terminal domain-containing protein [Candidatus Coprovivens excrementavium]|nr:TetR family transcriptional regulator C-terminal domain-containing protein [Candidatus Coprovivens excrementavium]